MRSIALLPSIALLAGVSAGTVTGALPGAAWILVALWAGASGAWWRRCDRAAVAAATAGYVVAGIALGAAAARDALQPSVHALLDDGSLQPLTVRARLLEDAAQRDFGVSLRAAIESVHTGHDARPIEGGVRLTVAGAAAARRVSAWRAGRLVEAPVTLRRVTRYLNDGVPDFERDQALDGVALVGSVKSGLLVEVVDPGTPFEEAAADLRAHVRRSVTRWIGRHGPVAAAIVTAILIGDRTALPDAVRDRLQAAGTYHVIAISGGNIAVLAALMSGVLMLGGATGRASALAVISGLAVYGCVVSAGPSVWRATATAIVYLSARLIDHRSPPWNALAVSAALLACAAPLDVRDVGFALTFGATAAIVEAARRVGDRRSVVTWAVTVVAASLAVEIALLPISAAAFSRVTAAGLLLNLLAVPLMAVTQVAGLLTVALGHVDWIGAAAGAVAAFGAGGLVESARLVDFWPWLALRVPPPTPAVVVLYYVALGCTLWARRFRLVSVVVLGACLGAILTGRAAAVADPHVPGTLRLTMFDVGQGEALLVQTPDGRTLMVDAGGAGFDGTAFDIGGRVLAPALWARGVRHLDAFAITHGDPDHIGGALALVRDFGPREIWEGIPVHASAPLQAVLSAGATSGSRVTRMLAGVDAERGGARIRVLHPPPADWERPRVRNDDSLVLEVRFGDVAFLLTGDIGADVERSLLPRLSDAPIRILKVAHHGSRTSTSQALVGAWKPQVALISCGRDNRFGHPAAEVMGRLERAGLRIYRTDREGQVTVDTDGQRVSVRTFLGGRQ